MRGVCTGRNLYESQVIMGYLEDISPNTTSLFPKDPMDKANARLWMDHIAKKICPVFFRVLQAQVRQGHNKLLWAYGMLLHS